MHVSACHGSSGEVAACQTDAAAEGRGALVKPQTSHSFNESQFGGRLLLVRSPSWQLISPTFSSVFTLTRSGGVTPGNCWIQCGLKAAIQGGRFADWLCNEEPQLVVWQLFLKLVSVDVVFVIFNQTHPFFLSLVLVD